MSSTDDDPERWAVAVDLPFGAVARPAAGELHRSGRRVDRDRTAGTAYVRFLDHPVKRTEEFDDVTLADLDGFDVVVAAKVKIGA